jgi:hypothetical protein
MSTLLLIKPADRFGRETKCPRPILHPRRQPPARSCTPADVLPETLPRLSPPCPVPPQSKTSPPSTEPKPVKLRPPGSLVARPKVHAPTQRSCGVA